MSEVTSTQAASGSNRPHNIEPSDVYCISDKVCRHDWGNKPEPIKGDLADERENCDPTAHYDPCIPYTGCADSVPSIGCGRHQGDRTPGEARTLELNLEDAERLMPQPTTKAPWFGYESYADYGDDGLDAVADNDGDSKKSGGRAPAAKASSAGEGSERATEGKSRVDGAASAATPDPSGDGGTTGATKAAGCSGPDKTEVEVNLGVLKIKSTWDGDSNEDGGGDPSVGDSRHSK